ncbi:MAG: alpha/beta hydrolase [Clostridia bacterium]|nr:alpha/beta hydrolase [Clostridia bacterium]
MLFLYILLGLLALFFLISFVCFFITFCAFPENTKEEFPIPRGKIYEPYRDMMVQWMKETRALNPKEVSIKSFDGLTLYGKYYEYSKDAPIELMFHGYRGNGERDLCGGVQRCFKLGRSCLIVDQRAAGKSGGKVITFGVKESRDCLKWIDYIIENINSDAKIIITGISMGAATVAIAAGEKLPKNVIAALADCGYTSAKDIIKKVMTDLKLPPKIFYPFVKFGARIYGGFDLEQYSPIEAMKNCTIPIIFIHGTTDAFVPYEMSVENFNACTHKIKKLVTIDNAGHGLAYLKDTDAYFKGIFEFDEMLSNQ